MFFGRRGSITVFICIVLAVLVPLCCILVDLSRCSMARKQAETALKTCAESMLAAYDRQLKEQYGLFALYPRDTEAMEAEIFELLSQNLNVAASAEGVSDLYGFQVRSVEVIPFYNYSEPYVLQQQAAEFMKYRAPVQAVQEFYEKIKVMMGLMAEADMVERKMSLDKLMNNIRSSLVNVYYMLKEKLPAFNTDTKVPEKTLKDSVLEKVKSAVQIAASEIENANNQVNPIKEAQDGYMALYAAYSSAKDAYDSALHTLDSVGNSLSSKETELSSAKAQLANTTGSAVQALNSKIVELEGDVAELEAHYGSAENSYNMAYKDYMELDNAISPYRSDLETRLSKVIQSLNHAKTQNNDITQALNTLLSHITKHTHYHVDLIAMIDGLEPQLNDLDQQSESLQNDSRNSDSSVSDRIQGELDKQLKCIKKETFTEIRSQLSSNLAKLEKWQQALTDCLTLFNQAGYDLDNALKSAIAVKEEPQNGQKRYYGYGGYENVRAGLVNSESILSDLKAITQMKGIYSVPEYILEPQPNSKEYEAFRKWFYKNYYGLDSEAGEPEADDTELNQIREGIGSFAREVGQKGNDQSEQSGGGESETPDEPNDAGENEPGDLGLMDKLKRIANLPSHMGAISSTEVLKQIGEAIEESDQNQLIKENPFEKPVEGLDSVNENDKNFFDYEMARATELISIIKDAVANGIEGIIESLYMNEYIVSAFKCAATGDTIEHDIGYSRPLDTTYYDKGEVEYIIFGNSGEAENIGASQRSLFAIRLVFNLLHVYTDPDKMAATLSLATSIAGWTIFGIPVVQNFLLISWAGLESYVDSEILLKGGRVPLIKTSSSWYLGLESMVDYLKNTFLKNIKAFAQEQMEKGIDDASEAIEETVTGIINSKIDMAFAPFEKGLKEVVSDVSTAFQNEVASIFKSDLITSINFDNLDNFTETLESTVNGYINDLADRLKTLGEQELMQFKNACKDKIRALIFESDLYIGMVNKIKSVGDDLLNKGLTAVEGQIDKAFGAAGKSRSNHISAKLIMMDYTDYMRLMLLAVPTEKKALRAADLMQLNMQETSENYDLSIAQYKTYIFIKAEVDINLWFLPEKLFKKQDAGMISIEWSQGY